MSVNDSLLPASYRGVNFLVTSDSSENGRKLAVKEFPFSNIRYAEDLGALPPSYTIEAIVHGDKTNYKDRINRLINVLNLPGTGELIHPVYGAKQVSVSTYTINNSQTNLGVSSLRINFIQSSDNVQPVPNSDLVGAINSQSDKVFLALQNDFEETFYVKSTYKFNYISALQKLNNLYDVFLSATSGFVKDDKYINDYFSELNKFKIDSPSLIYRPNELSSAILNLFNSVNNIGLSASIRFDLFTKFFEYGENDTYLQYQTEEIIERNNNAQSLNTLVVACALTQCYRNTPQINYTTNDELEKYRNILSNEYNSLLSNNVVQSASNFELETNRDLVSEFFREANENVYNISEIEVKTIPLTKLTYLLYEDLENYDTLLDLNKVKDPSFLSGRLQVLSQ